MKFNDFRPTEEMIAATTVVMLCMAWEETVRPIVLKYKTEILKEMQAGPAEVYKKYAGVPTVILEPKDSWALGKADFAFYDACCKKERDDFGFIVATDDYCPLLVAEHQTLDAQRNLIDIMEPITKISVRQLTCNGLDRYMEYLNLTLKLLVPFIP